MRSIFIAALGAVCLLAAVARSKEPEGIRYRSIEIADGHFRCEVPEGWYFDRDERAEARIRYHGFYLHGPKGGEDIGPALSVRYFAPDNTLFRGGAEGYLDRQLGPSLVKPIDEKTSEPRDVTVAGRPAKTFTRDTVEFFPPESLDSKKIPVREEHYVVPYLDGFVVVRFEAPTRSWAASRRVLARVLDTLRLLPETTYQTLRFTAPGLAADEIEARITKPVEAALENIPSLKETWSASLRGECLIVLALPATDDPEDLRRELRHRLTPLRAALPPRTHVAFDPALPAGEPALSVTIRSTSDASEVRPAAIARLSALTERLIRSRIITIPGVAEATPVGARPRYEIVMSGERFRDDVDVRDLIAAVRNEPTPAGAAADGLAIDDLARRVVAVRNGRQVTVGDLAELRLAATDPAADGARPADAATGERAVGLTIRSAPGFDSGAVYRAVELILDEIRTTLPEGADFAYRRSAGTVNPVWESLGISGESIVLKVAGSEQATVAEAAARLRDELAKIDGAADWTAVPASGPALQIHVRREQAMRYGFDEKAIGEIIAGAEAIVRRRTVCRITGPHETPIDVAVVAGGDGPTAVGKLRFLAPEGMSVPLTAIADLALADEPAAVVRAAGRPVVFLAGRVAVEDRARVESRLEDYLRNAKVPAGCSIGFVGKE